MSLCFTFNNNVQNVQKIRRDSCFIRHNVVYAKVGHLFT